jgi:hypothetical protein
MQPDAESIAHRGKFRCLSEPGGEHSAMKGMRRIVENRAELRQTTPGRKPNEAVCALHSATCPCGLFPIKNASDWRRDLLCRYPMQVEDQP